ncbi:unnamed protein product, partial [Discosporangium mesarthrocarpum]
DLELAAAQLIAEKEHPQRKKTKKQHLVLGSGGTGLHSQQEADDDARVVRPRSASSMGRGAGLGAGNRVASRSGLDQLEGTESMHDPRATGGSPSRDLAVTPARMKKKIVASKMTSFFPPRDPLASWGGGRYRLDSAASSAHCGRDTHAEGSASAGSASIQGSPRTGQSLLIPSMPRVRVGRRIGSSPTSLNQEEGGNSDEVGEGADESEDENEDDEMEGRGNPSASSSPQESGATLQESESKRGGEEVVMTGRRRHGRRGTCAVVRCRRRGGMSALPLEEIRCTGGQGMGLRAGGFKRRLLGRLFRGGLREVPVGIGRIEGGAVGGGVQRGVAYGTSPGGPVIVGSVNCLRFDSMGALLAVGDGRGGVGIYDFDEYLPKVR